MQKFKIVISYDGTSYQGWQSQPHKKTVADCLGQAFHKVFGQPIALLGASRTDSGVHALRQVATFKTDLNLENLNQIMRGWNNILPADILIRSIEKVPDSFNPLLNVSQKIYYYNIFLSCPLPFFVRYGWFYDFIGDVDWKKFEKAVQLFIGKHDFRSFCKVEDDDRSTIRTIDNISIKKFSGWDMIQITIKGKSFLHFQIRRMVGYALDVSRRDDLSLDYLLSILDNPSPFQTLTRAEARGLFLCRIIYENERK